MAGKRYSRQRELIFDAVCGTDQHPTAEMVYHWLKPTNPNLSLGTVYRNLNLLAEEGVLVRMPFPVERYKTPMSCHTPISAAGAAGACSTWNWLMIRGLTRPPRRKSRDFKLRTTTSSFPACALSARAGEEK